MLKALPPAITSFSELAWIAVVAHVADPAQDQALRKALRAIHVAGAQLAQHRNERVAHQRVDLVDEKNERTGGRWRPSEREIP